MAKVSKVNVAITGDSSGLQKAGDQAQATMRRIRAQADATGRSLGGFRGQANQVAESLTKLGVGGRALQGLGAVAGLGQLGIGAATGGPAGVAFAGLAAAAISVNALADSYAQLRVDAKAAAAAMDSGVRTAEQWRKAGFTREGGEALAAYSRTIGAEPIGFGRAFTQSTAMGGGGRTAAMDLLEYDPGALGAILGGLLSGQVPTAQTVAGAIGEEEQRRVSEAAGTAGTTAAHLVPGAGPFIQAQSFLSEMLKYLAS